MGPSSGGVTEDEKGLGLLSLDLLEGIDVHHAPLPCRVVTVGPAAKAAGRASLRLLIISALSREGHR